MPPITGHFLADFTDFNRAVKLAEVELRGFEEDANKVARSLGRMADSFSGRKVIQDATVMAEAVARIGGTSKLTEAEFARLSRTVTEATDKMRRMGVDVPPALQAITKEATSMQRAFAEMDASRPFIQLGPGVAGATSKLAGLSAGLGQVDRILAAMGTNIGPQIGALRELELAVGGLSTGLTRLGWIGAVTGGALIAMNTDWGKVGEKIEDVRGTIADTTASLMGWGNVAKEEAAANAHLLAEASATAEREITDLSEAMRINKGEAERMAREQEEAAEAAARLTEAARDKLRAHLADRIRLSREGAAADERAAQAYEDSIARMTEAREAAQASLAQDFFGHRDWQQAQDLVVAIGDVAKVAEMGAEAQARLAGVMRDGLEAAIRLGLGTDIMTSQMEAFRLEATRTGREAAEGLAKVEQQARETAAAVAAMANTMTIVGAPLEPGMSELARPQSLLRPQPLNQRGVSIYGGNAAGESVLTDYAPTVVNNNINMNGVLLSNDPSARASLRQAIDDVLTQGIMKSRRFSF